MKHRGNWIRIACMTLLLVAATAGVAQEVHERGPSPRIRGFFAPVAELTALDGETGVLAGIRGAVYVSERMYVGMEGVGLINEARVETGPYPAEGSGYQYLNWYGRSWLYSRLGLVAGYRFYPGSRTGAVVELSAGVGRIDQEIDQPEIYEDNFGEPFDPDPDNHMYLQPMIMAEWEVVRWLRVDAGLGYRVSLAINKFGRGSGDFTAPVLSLGLRIGNFPEVE